MKTVIVGAGPAGIFAALQLAGTHEVVLIDKGKKITDRDSKLDMLEGFGGSGAFSDGKLTITDDVGGWLTDIDDLIAQVDQMYVNFGAPSKVYNDDAGDLVDDAAKHGLELINYPVRHIGTDNLFGVIDRMYDTLNKFGVDIMMETRLTNIITDGDGIIGIETTNGGMFCDNLIVAPGRANSSWLKKELFGRVSTTTNPVDIGVRIELPAEVMEPITSRLYEIKYKYVTEMFKDHVRTFCVCPHGEVTMEKSGDIYTVNGHSNANKKTNRTNLAILVSQQFTEPFNDPVSYVRSISRLSNLIGNSVTVQSANDMALGRRSTDNRIGWIPKTLKSANPGDLGLILPFRIMVDILEMMSVIDKVTPGFVGPETLMYGVETKMYSNRFKVSRNMETDVNGLYICGDGGGMTRGLMQSSVSGLLAANHILEKINEKVSVL